MKLAELQAMGAFVSAKPIKREIKIKRPVELPRDQWATADVPEYGDESSEESLTIFIRRGSAADAIEMLGAGKRERPFVAIYNAICHEDGTRLFESVEQAESLQLWIAMPMFEAITEVAGNGPKHSRRRTNSGSKPASPTASRKRS